MSMSGGSFNLILLGCKMKYQWEPREWTWGTLKLILSQGSDSNKFQQAVVIKKKKNADLRFPELPTFQKIKAQVFPQKSLISFLYQQFI